MTDRLETRFSVMGDAYDGVLRMGREVSLNVVVRLPRRKILWCQFFE